jgi:hypothetical protein
VKAGVVSGFMLGDELVSIPALSLSTIADYASSAAICPHLSPSYISPSFCPGVEQHLVGAGTSLPHPCSFQLNASSAAVKAAFPSCFIFYNEGGAPLYEGRNINHFPAP